MCKTVVKKYSFVTCYWAFVILLLTGCASVQPVVKIGLVGPFEGQHRAIGYDLIYSARLAVREMNADGGIGGYRVSLVALDDGGNVEMAKETAVSLTLDSAIIAVVGHGLPETSNAVAPIYKKANILFLSLGKRPPHLHGSKLFAEADPANYSADFRAAYQSVTPFDEEPGAYAKPAYDAFTFLREAIIRITKSNKPLTREAIFNS